jgi:hypothetical protein
LRIIFTLPPAESPHKIQINEENNNNNKFGQIEASNQMEAIQTASGSKKRILFIANHQKTTK